VARVPRWGFETLALVVLGLSGWAVLIALDAVLRNGLWGEWTFAMIGCSLGTWLLARLAAARLPERFMFVPPRLWQAPLWAAVPLVGVPFAALTMPWGIVLFAGVLIGLLLAARWLRWTPPPWLQPIQWVAALASVIAVTAFVATGTATDTGDPAAATPPVPDAMALALRYRPFLFFDSRERFFPMKAA
jgi:hypothetical protein